MILIAYLIGFPILVGSLSIYFISLIFGPDPGNVPLGMGIGCIVGPFVAIWLADPVGVNRKTTDCAYGNETDYCTYILTNCPYCNKSLRWTIEPIFKRKKQYGAAHITEKVGERFIVTCDDTHIFKTWRMPTHQ